MDQESRKLSGGFIASLGGLAVLIIFIVQNTNDVSFDFLFASFTWPLWLYTIVIAVFGALAWFGFGVMRRHRRRVERRDNRGSADPVAVNARLVETMVETMVET